VLVQEGGLAVSNFTIPQGVPVDHARKFVVVVDDSPECKLAMRFAAGRAAHTLGGQLVLFHVIAPTEFVQWGAVQAMMEQEAREAADLLLAGLADEVRSYAGLEAERIIRQGKPTEQLLSFLEGATDLFALVLGASKEGDPGPLVDFFSGPIAGSLPCPVLIVPGGMSPQRLDSLV
jgi:nucleotide-binding universal stress UspA family protein